MTSSPTEGKKIVFFCYGNTCRSPMAELYWRFKELQSGKIDDLESDSSLAMSRGIWELEGCNIDDQAPASRPHVTIWFKKKREESMPGITDAVNSWMLSHYSKNILTVQVPQDARFVLITTSIDRGFLQQWGYEATSVVYWDNIPDPWGGKQRQLHEDLGCSSQGSRCIMGTVLSRRMICYSPIIVWFRFY